LYFGEHIESFTQTGLESLSFTNNETLAFLTGERDELESKFSRASNLITMGRNHICVIDIDDEDGKPNEEEIEKFKTFVIKSSNEFVTSYPQIKSEIENGIVMYTNNPDLIMMVDYKKWVDEICEQDLLMNMRMQLNNILMNMN
jgi:hypothetical protein